MSEDSRVASTLRFLQLSDPPLNRFRRPVFSPLVLFGIQLPPSQLLASLRSNSSLSFSLSSTDIDASLFVPFLRSKLAAPPPFQPTSFPRQLSIMSESHYSNPTVSEPLEEAGEGRKAPGVGLGSSSNSRWVDSSPSFPMNLLRELPYFFFSWKYSVLPGSPSG